MPTTKQVKLINIKKFVKMILDDISKTFIMLVAALKAPLTEIMIYSLQIAKITGIKPIQIATLKQDKAFTKVLAKYLDF